MNLSKTLAMMVRPQMVNLSLVRVGRGDELGPRDYLDLKQRALVTHDADGRRVLTGYGRRVYEEMPA